MDYIEDCVCECCQSHASNGIRCPCWTSYLLLTPQPRRETAKITFQRTFTHSMTFMSSIPHDPPPRPTNYIVPCPQRLLINLLWLFRFANVCPTPTTLGLLSSWPLIDILFWINNPLREGNYFASLCIGSFNESDRRKLYGSVIRIACECCEIWRGPLGIQRLD